MEQTAVSTNGVGQFKRGDQVVCKPDALAAESGVGQVQDVLFGFVIVYFEPVGARLYFPYELDAFTMPAGRLALGTPVILANGVSAVVTGHSTCDCKRYELVWFDRHVWQVRRRWIDRGAFEVLETKTPASTEVLTGAS